MRTQRFGALEYEVESGTKPKYERLLGFNKVGELQDAQT